MVKQIDAIEVQDWLASLQDVLARHGREQVRALLREVEIGAQRAGVILPSSTQTPYVNTIAPEDEPMYPGDREIERRIRNLVRWNAMAMVVRGNKHFSGIGGHISTSASIATLYEVGCNHFFRGRDDPSGGDHVYFQGHASPGNYARAFLEGRMSREQLEHFRREVADGPAAGLSSYPHPWLMPDFWEFPTVSMGLGPIQAIYRARFMRYLENRGLREPTDARVWCFVGDGETDEPESLSGITLAAREQLENLIFVINCNLQRLDGPVRGNGKIVQELESRFRGAGWNVIKVLWGSEWDELFARDRSGTLVRRLGELVDGDHQKFSAEGGAYIREHFFAKDPELSGLVDHMTDDELWRLRLGGHDADKVHAAYRAAVEFEGAPTVILAKTVKGYGLGEAGEGRNVTHQQKKLNEEELLAFRDRFDVPLSDDDVAEAPFFKPADDSPEIEYLLDRRRELGGFVPSRKTMACGLEIPGDDVFADFREDSGDRDVATTMALVRMVRKLMRAEDFGPRIVPIIPDEARTFGMDSLFHEVGIYAQDGQQYEPVDRESLMYYKEARDGQILEEGITEAGSMSTFIAAGTGHACHGICTIPFFFFYSMFGFQRVGDLIWAAGDSRARGFLVGATAGRTTLNGEGLQHQDGHSHLAAQSIPNLCAYDPAYSYEIAVIVRDGLRRMYRDDEDVFYYLTAYNEPYHQPAMPAGVEDGILRGVYRVRECLDRRRKAQAHLLGSGPILREAIAAQELLAEKFDIASEVWSVTSYKRLRDEALSAERWNLLHPASEPRVSYLRKCFEGAEECVFVAASDYVKAMPDSIAKWLPGPLTSLGTDGYGRSDTRKVLRDFFEVDARYIALAALRGLAMRNDVEPKRVRDAVHELDIDPDKLEPTAS